MWLSRRDLEEAIQAELARARPRVAVTYALRDDNDKTIGREPAGTHPMKNVPDIGERVFTPNGKYGRVTSVSSLINSPEHHWHDDADVEVVADLFR